jgi:hypothetical protein
LFWCDTGTAGEMVPFVSTSGQNIDFIIQST